MTKKIKKSIALALACILLLPLLAGCGEEAEEVVSIQKAYINKAGELIITYTDGIKDNLGVVVGADGSDGQDGTDGLDGNDGSDGSSGGSIVEVVGTALRSSVSIFCTYNEGRDESYAGGSGVIYQLDKEQGNAFVITNYHVVHSSDGKTNNGISENIKVYLYGGELEGQEIQAQYVGGSQNYDIAVLYLENSELLKNSDVAPVSIGDSDQVIPGQTAIAVGNAEGEGISVTTGIVSVESEQITLEASDGTKDIDHRVMRIDTAVNHGNSGGGLFNDRGQLIGIVNAKMVEEDVENIGYAIPSSVAIAVAQNIIDYCFEQDCTTAMRPMLGITIVNSASKGVYDETTGTMRIEQTIQVAEIGETSLVYGLMEVDDVFVAITLNGQTRQITRQHHVIDMMLWARAGDEIQLTIRRGDMEEVVCVTLPESCLTEY